MREFTTKNEAVEVFEFKVDGKKYKIPVAAALPIKVVRSMDEADKAGNGFAAQIDMLRLYMGDIVDELPTGVASDILKAWAEANKSVGAPAGE